MEHNKEQVIKALEHCVSGYCYRDGGCPLANDDDYDDDISKCTSILSKNALSLIKELIAENESLRAEICDLKIQYKI